ncbi:MAG: hypothetical protein KOO60_07050 [Gemmatimonadales bacterium]|nr:hypothetical protein [Gemmatimonadales bacterium]
MCLLRSYQSFFRPDSGIPGSVGFRFSRLFDRVSLLFLFLLLLLNGTQAHALDFFTLWRQPNIPLQITEGSWADYRTQVMKGGRRESNLVRISCLDRPFGTDDESWAIELLFLEEKKDGSLVPLPGQGTRLRISRELLNREGQLLDFVLEIDKWQDGIGKSISPEEIRDDPLLAAYFSSEFVPDQLVVTDQTTRVVQGRQLLCDQFTMAAVDSQSARLPAGEMIQVSSWEITAAVNSEVPFLGLAFVTERVRSESRLDPPNKRMNMPPPRIRVELMELVAFGIGAEPVLGMFN